MLMKALPCLLLVVLVLTWGPAPARAGLSVQGFTTQRHDRFYVGGDKAFIGDPFDWSGIGRTLITTASGPNWATMISPTHYITAEHGQYAGSGQVVRFYHTNDPTGAFEDRTAVGTPVAIPNSDIRVGTLSAPVSSNVAIYPILSNPYFSQYLGLDLLIAGRSVGFVPEQSTRVGANVSDFAGEVFDVDENSLGFYLEFDLDFGLPDDAYFQSGDSSGPSFVVIDGELVLVGVHSYRYQDPDDSSLHSGDALLGHYAAQIQGILDGAGNGESITIVQQVPEPSPVVFLGAAITLALARRRRRRTGRA